MNSKTGYTLIVYLALLGTNLPPIFAQINCSTDTIPPTCIPPNDTVLTCLEFDGLRDLNIYQIRDSIPSLFGEPTFNDNCDYEVEEILPELDESILCGWGTMVRQFIGTDLAGNQTTCQQTVTIEFGRDYQIYIPGDRRPTDNETEDVQAQYLGCDLISISTQQSSWCTEVNNQNFIRTHHIINWCEAGIIEVAPPVRLPRLDIDGDGIAGDPFWITYKEGSIYLIRDGLPDLKLFESTGYIIYDQFLIENQVEEPVYVYGNIFNDTNNNCSFETDEYGLNGYRVRAIGHPSNEVYETVTAIDGSYSLALCQEDSSASINLVLPFNYSQVCPLVHEIDLTAGSSLIHQDIPVQLDATCNLLGVTIGAPFIRRCFENYYTVNYCNFSSEAIENTYVEVELDPFMHFLEGTIPHTDLSDNRYRFNIGELEAGACGRFLISYELSCDAELGQSHCTKASIFPNVLCETGSMDLWTGAQVEVTAICDSDSVRMSISNIGDGDMQEHLQYIVVEDVLLMQMNEFRLNAEESIDFAFPANGSTWRLEAEQEPFFPEVSLPSATIEGCGGNNNPGIASLLTPDDASPFVDVDCQPNIGSYDPNDITGFPFGVGEEHTIPPNISLEYRIRFQNTGTDTAFQVVITDTISNKFNFKSIHPGSSSHTYEFEAFPADEGGGIVRFTFSNILLPDSTTNESASMGFVQFTITQEADLPDDTRLENTAAIYFDFNEAIVTNTYHHTINRNIFDSTNNTINALNSRPTIKVSPNPIGPKTDLSINGIQLLNGQLTLYSPQGRHLLTKKIIGNRCQLSNESLAAGIYFYQIYDNQQIVGIGKLIHQ